jgi:hypothetical protein
LKVPKISTNDNPADMMTKLIKFKLSWYNCLAQVVVWCQQSCFFDCFRIMFACYMLQDGIYLKIEIVEL